MNIRPTGLRRCCGTMTATAACRDISTRWDVGLLYRARELMSVATAKEFFLLTEWSEGATYHKDLERMAGATKPTALDPEADRSVGHIFGRHSPGETDRSTTLSASASRIARPR